MGCTTGIINSDNSETYPMREQLKATINVLFALLNAPPILLYYVLLIFADKDQLFAGFSQFYSLFPGRIGNYIRRNFYRFVLPDFGKNITIGFGTVFSHRDTHIGDNVYIGPQCNIGMCRIGPECLIGSGVHILSGRNQHNFSDKNMPLREQGGHYSKIEIGDNCWIGNLSVIMGDVAAHSVIGAGSIITEAPKSGIYLGTASTMRTNDQ